MTTKRRWALLFGGFVLIAATTIVATQLSNSEEADSCTNRAVCFRSTPRSTFPHYGNVYPSNLADCMFAAAANWQTIVLGSTPRAQQVKDEYLAAAQSSSSGVDEDLFIWWWTTQGIGNVRIQGWEVLSQINEERIKEEIRRYKAVFAIFTFRRHATVAGRPVGIGGHAAIIDGYTAKGPLVVTWGHTYQMTWGEYWRSINSLRAITR